MQRMVWLDSLRLIAGLSMVVLHCTADANGQPWVEYTPTERIGPLLLRSIAYMARTELFIMISAFLLLWSLERRPRGYAITISEQAKRLLIPFIVWTVFYAFYGLIKASHFGYAQARLAELSDLQTWLGFFLLGDVKYHMHFLPTLFLLLLFYPLFRYATQNVFLGWLGIIFLLLRWEVEKSIYSNFWQTDILPYFVRGTKVMAYIGYGLAAAAFVGLLLRGKKDKNQKWLFLIVALGFVAFAIKVIAMSKTVETGEWQHGYYPGYVANFLMPILLFGACFVMRHRNWPMILSRLAPFAFGIYLAHPIFLDVAEIFIKNASLSPTYQVGSKIIFTLICTAGFVQLISRLSMTAWTIGLGDLPRIGLKNDKIKKGALHAD